MITLDGQDWEFDCDVHPEQEGRPEVLEVTEVYRYEGMTRIQYDGDYTDHEINELAEKALAAMNEY